VLFMSGIKCLYILNGLKVYNIPQPKDWVFKPISELAKKNVLMVNLYYKTINRKPSELCGMNFDRVNLNEDGGYILTKEIANLKVRNFIEFGFYTAEELSKREDPWSIPDAPIIPSKEEIDAIKKYLKEHYPVLYKDSAQIILREIQEKERIHHRNINLIKKAIKIRNSVKK